MEYIYIRRNIMLHLIKRVFYPLLCAAVICGILTGTAAAEDPAEKELLMQKETETEVTYFSLPEVSYVNPLYADVLSESDILTAPVLDSDSSGESEEIVYLTYDEAVEELRQKLISREESFDINVHLKSPSSDEITGIINNLFTDAREHTGNPKEGDSIRWQWATINCTPGDNDCRRVGDAYYFDLPYVFTYYTTAEQEEIVDTAVEELMAEIFPEGASDFEIVKAAYDWICENVRYDYNNLNNASYKLKYSAYAALIDNTAVCQGYALLMYRLLLEQGIDCRLIPGDGGGPHAWNIVELDNVYYNLDATWDEGKAPEFYNWFLLNQESFVDHERYNNDSYGYYDSAEFHASYPMSEENYFSEDDRRAGDVLDEANGIRWDLTYGGTLIISGEGAMPDFSQVTEEGYISINTTYLPWNALRGSIRKIVVEPGITSLGNGAFFESVYAESAEIADTVTKIGMWAFTGCTSLKEIEIPADVTSLAYEAFKNCTALEEITFHGDTPPAAGSSVFSGTAALAAVYVPAGSYDAYVTAYSNVLDTGLIIAPAVYTNEAGMYVYNSEDGEYHAVGGNHLDTEKTAIWLNETTASGYQDPSYGNAENVIQIADAEHGWYDVILCGIGSDASAFPENMSGKIAFCLRGDSPFTVKAENAMNAGAALFLIGNNCREAEAIDANGNVTGQYENTTPYMEYYTIPSALVSSDISVRIVAAAAGVTAAEAVEAITEIYNGSLEFELSHVNPVRVFLGTQAEYLDALEDARNDTNGDGTVTVADVLYLLRHTILPSRYPLHVGNADYDGSGSVDVRDAVRLLQYID